MRIIQTVNDTIRLLFNPKTEVFCLSDFLLVRDVRENFLAQVIEIYDDKFDQESNVAKIRLVYRIVNGNEIAPYDNYTPSRECEVARIKQADIEKCINLNKKTINIGISERTKEKTEINTDFFENNCVIFADKFEQTNQMFENLAPKLSGYKNVLVLDFSGSCTLNNSNNFIAGKNFKIPLSSDTIDYIQQKTLLRAKLETQVILGDVFEEVKNYLANSEDNYIPFENFINVILSQCKQSPMVELLVLLSWLKKYSRAKIFAKQKSEFEDFINSIKNNKITTLDMSNIKSEWQKEYVEYIVNNIENDAFVMIRLNDNNINSDIINSIYFKKKNISFIPGFAYGYKKAAYLMEFAQNYILMPTLNPKRNFTHANFQIQSLNEESSMFYGEDTKGFIFIIENEARKNRIAKSSGNKNNKMFISLNLQLEDMTALELRPDDFEKKPVDLSKLRAKEEISLSDVLDNDMPEEEHEIEEETGDDEKFLGEDELDFFENEEETEEETNDEIIEAEEIIEENPEETEDAEEEPEEEEEEEVININPEEESKEIFEEETSNEESSFKTETNSEFEKFASEQNEEEEEIDKKFDEILNEENEIKQEETLKINENVSIDLNKIKKDTKQKEQKLPIFTDEEETEENEEDICADFSEKDRVSHEKYGEGEVLKVIKYGARCLLQIEFPEVGKRLLDPKIAKLKPADEA